MTEIKDESDTLVKCVVKNCQKEIFQRDAIVVEGQFYCKTCGVALFRTTLNL